MQPRHGQRRGRLSGVDRPGREPKLLKRSVRRAVVHGLLRRTSRGNHRCTSSEDRRAQPTLGAQLSIKTLPRRRRAYIEKHYHQYYTYCSSLRNDPLRVLTKRARRGLSSEERALLPSLRPLPRCHPKRNTTSGSLWGVRTELQGRCEGSAGTLSAVVAEAAAIACGDNENEQPTRLGRGRPRQGGRLRTGSNGLEEAALHGAYSRDGVFLTRFAPLGGPGGDPGPRICPDPEDG